MCAGMVAVVRGRTRGMFVVGALVYGFVRASTK